MVAGPKLVERAWSGLKLTKTELGGMHIHNLNGVCHNLAVDEDDALQQIQRFLSFLPQNVWELAPVVKCGDDPNRMAGELSSIIPNSRSEGYDMRRVLSLVFDTGSIFEMKRNYGPSLITVFARLNGQAVGCFANDCSHYAGSMSADASKKTQRFIGMFPSLA